jgi:hypothetical protein
MQPTHTQAQKTVAGIHFPATRDGLVDYARDRGADDELLECLRLLPRRQYRDPNEVGAAVAEVTKEATW